MQFLVNTVQKRIIMMQKEGNEMQMSQRMEHFSWLINDGKFLGTNLLAGSWRVH